MQSALDMWRGKKAAFIGDSITEGVGSDKAYHEYLSEWLGIEALNYGVNGASTRDMLSLAQKLRQNAPDVNAVFLFGGTNDFNGGLPMGEFYTSAFGVVNHNGTEQTRLRRELVMDDKCFCGRLNRVLRELKLGFPKAQVILMTPIHRGYAIFSPNNVQPDESWANSQNLFIDDYVSAVRKAADIWSTPLIDLYRDCGLLPAFSEYAPYFHLADTDCLHPGARGHERIALAIVGALSGIYPA